MGDINKNYYVYLHIGNNSGKIRYIGKGKGNRYNYFGYRNLEYEKTIIIENGFKSIILQDNLTEESALELESEVLYRFQKSKSPFIVNKQFRLDNIKNKIVEVPYNEILSKDLFDEWLFKTKILKEKISDLKEDKFICDYINKKRFIIKKNI